MPAMKFSEGRMLDIFINKMLEDKGVEEANRAELREQLRRKLEEQIEQAIIRALPDDKLVELEKLLDENAPDGEVEKFFEEAGVDYNSAVEQVMTAFREAFMQSTEVGEA